MLERQQSFEGYVLVLLGREDHRVDVLAAGEGVVDRVEHRFLLLGR